MSNIIEEKLGIDLSKADGETRGFLRFRRYKLRT